MIGVGVIGYGYWGPKAVRALLATSGCRVIAVCDVLAERRRVAVQEHPAIESASEAGVLLRDPRIDAIVIATPAPSHYALAHAALGAGKHVFVEKPFTATLDEALRLVDEVARCGRVLIVDHTFLYAGAVRTVRQLASADLGELIAYDAVRANCGVRRTDVNVIWDLAVHDLSIMDLVLPSPPCAIAASARTRAPGALEDAACLQLWFSGSLVGRVEVDWLAPVKVRRTRVDGRQGTVVYDDCEALDKVRFYAPSADPQHTTAGNGGGRALPLDHTAPLQAAAAHFVRCIEADEPPAHTDAAAGLRVVRLLDAATRSLRSGGRPIELA